MPHLEQHDFHCARQQLQKAEELRQQGQRSLGELKEEFEELTRDLVESTADSPPQPSRQPEYLPMAQGNSKASPRLRMSGSHSVLSVALVRAC